MKLTVALAAAFAGYGAAAQQTADVYMLPRPDSSSPSISRSLARLILLQRLAPSGKGPSTTDIPDGAEDIVSLMNQFGKAPAPLFTDDEATAPRQLMVMLEGMTEEQIDNMSKELGTAPAFTIQEPPADAVYDGLAMYDLYDVGVTSDNKCSLRQLVGSSEGCWSGKSAVKRLDVQKDPQSLKELSLGIAVLEKFAKARELETTIVVLPAVAETSNTKYWSDKPQDLRRRQEVEQTMPADEEEESPAAAPSDPSKIFYTSNAPVPSCFSSEDSCVTGTGNCSSHGTCVNSYARPDGSEGNEVCYQCYCQKTASKSGSITHWAGAACSKKDVSVAFWLFAGFTLVMVSVLYMAIGLLFSVGEEKLPGVIGAGVSKSK